MIVYGKNVMGQLQKDPSEIQEVYLQNGMRDGKILDLLKRNPQIRLKTLSRQEMDRLCDGGVHQGIAAKTKDIPTISLDELIGKVKKKSRLPLVVALDEVQDPHNVGAILRSVDASGADGLILCKHNGAGLTPAAVKASTGAAYTIPVCEVSSLSKALRALKESGFWIAGTDFDEQSVDYRTPDYEVPLVLVIGNEGKGMNRAVKKECDYKVHLPMRGSVQSLNASVAAGILLYEIQGQREEKAKNRQ